MSKNIISSRRGFINELFKKKKIPIFLTNDCCTRGDVQAIYNTHIYIMMRMGVKFMPLLVGA